MISPDTQEVKYPGLARQVTCDGVSVKKQYRRVGSRYRLQRRNFKTISGPGNVSGFLCQEHKSSASVKNYKGQMATRWCASIGAERTDSLAESPSAMFERIWRLREYKCCT